VQQELEQDTWIHSLRNKITTATHLQEFVSFRIRRTYSCSLIWMTRLNGNRPMIGNIHHKIGLPCTVLRHLPQVQNRHHLARACGEQVQAIRLDPHSKQNSNS
jgi:hypothetical protein